MVDNDSGGTGSDVSLDKSTEWHRFLLAALLIGGFLVLVGLGMTGNYEDPTSLMGMFSAWIVAIVGFYFVGQASDKVQKQATDITDKARRIARITTQEGEGGYQEVSDQVNKKIADLEEQIAKYRILIKRYKQAYASPPTGERTPHE